MLRTVKTVALAVAVLLALTQVAVAGGILLARATGYEYMSILGGSMEPLYQAGDAVVMEVEKAKDPEVGTVITFRAANGQLTTHRVIDAVELESGPHYQTQGDANTAPDANLVHPDAIVGTPTRHVPGGGRVAAAVLSPVGQLVGYGPLLTWIFLTQLRQVRSWWRGRAAAGTA